MSPLRPLTCFTRFRPFGPFGRISLISRRVGSLLLSAGFMVCSPAFSATATAATAAATTAEATVQQARQAGRDNRHAEAIAAWARAIEARPGQRAEWLLEWADQHTWAGRLDEAMALYREALAQPVPGDPQRTRNARIGLARALSWADRQAAALQQYEQVLRDHPGDEEALRGIGRVQSWRGRQREAAQGMQQFLQGRPHDREATLVLAESLAWMGRADRALPLLRAQLAKDPGDARSASLLRKLQRELRPVASVDWRDFDQSDGLAISELSLAWRQPLAEGRGHLGARYSQAHYRPPASSDNDLRVQRPGVEGRYRISDALEWNGGLWLDLIEPRNGRDRARRWTHDTYLTWWPSDVWRLDLGSARWTFDSEEALRKGLTATQLKLSVDLLPDELTRLTTRVHRAEHSDGNRREGWQFEAERRIWHGPRVHLGYRLTGYGFTMPGQGGYFNPETLRSHELWLQAAGWTRAGIGWNLRWTLGRERSQPGDSRPIRAGSASLAWEVDETLLLEAAYDYSTSRTLSTGGFQRGVARLGLRYRH